MTHKDTARAGLAALALGLAAPASAADPSAGGLASGEGASERAVWADVYAESYGWVRPGASTDLVPTLRLRGLWQPFEAADLHVYLYAQGTRDLASRGVGAAGPLLIYADNHLLTGVGAMYTLWAGRIALFGQAGPAIALIDDGGPAVQLDARAGLQGFAETGACRDGDRGWCLEAYSEVVWVSRFDNAVIGLLRPRVAHTLLETGDVLWQPVVEARLLADTVGYGFNNLADAGVGHRWRFRTDIPFDVMLGLHGGTYAPWPAVDDLPDSPRYLEARLQAATYFRTGRSR